MAAVCRNGISVRELLEVCWQLAAVVEAKSDAHVVNNSSVFGLIGVPSQSAYNASKFAVRGYTESLRQELYGTSVNVMCVHPGGVRTNIVRNGRNRMNPTGNAVDPEAFAREFEKVARTTPDRAARIIWRGALANAPRVLVGADARLIDLVARLFPAKYPTVFRGIERLLMRVKGAEEGTTERSAG